MVAGVTNNFVDRISTNGEIDWAKVKAESDKVAATAPPEIKAIFDRTRPITMADYERLVAHINHNVAERDYLLHLAKVCIDQNIDLRLRIEKLTNRMSALEIEVAQAQFEADGRVLAAAGQDSVDTALSHRGGGASGEVES
jgi:hypothetical protein